MKKIRGNYPDEFINKITESFLSALGVTGLAERTKAEIVKVRDIVDPRFETAV